MAFQTPPTRKSTKSQPQAQSQPRSNGTMTEGVENVEYKVIRGLETATMAVVGGVTFWTTTVVSGQVVLGKMLGLSCARPRGSSSIIGASVVTIACALTVKTGRIENELKRSEKITFLLGGVLLFKGLGGSFRAVLPSSIVHPGAFAKKSIPASPAYATESERARIADIGKRYGCHTCGKKPRNGLFVADHMPPNGVLKKKSKWVTSQQQRFYPQCYDCSTIQSSAVRDVIKHQVFHWKRFRKHHFTGVILAILLEMRLEHGKSKSKPMN